MAQEQWPHCLCLRTQSQKLLPKIQLPGWLVLLRWAKTAVMLLKECGREEIVKYFLVGVRFLLNTRFSLHNKVAGGQCNNVVEPTLVAQPLIHQSVFVTVGILRYDRHTNIV